MKKKIGILMAAILLITCMIMLVACGTGKVTIEFVTGTDEVIPTQVRSLDEAYGELPTPTRKYYKFCGWTTQPDGDETVSAASKPSGGSKYTLYARWEFVGAGRTRSTIASSGISNYVIDDNGELWAWGDNSFGQLGIGTRKKSYEPVKVNLVEKAVQVTAGEETAYTLTENGNIYAFGKNSEGQMGDGTLVDALSPQQINGSVKFSLIDACYSVFYGLDKNGNVWMCGNLDEIVESGGDSGNYYYHKKLAQRTKNIEFVDLAAGSEHACALDKDGCIWSWGKNSCGQLGIGTATSYTVPQKIKKDVKFMQIAASSNSTLALDENGKLWAWGDNGFSQLGDSSLSKQLSPKKIDITEDVPFVRISTDGATGCAVDANDNIWSWGRSSNNLYKELDGNILTYPVKILPDNKFEEIVAASNVYLAKTEDGNVYSWGNNSNGYIDSSYIEKSLIPQKIDVDVKFVQTASGSMHNIALDENGQLWAWGQNDSGQLGDGTNETRRSPTAIDVDAEFKYISAAVMCSYAIDTDGNLWSWGNNGDMQLGDGTQINRNTPQKLETDVKFESVFAGDRCAFAIDGQGRLYACGYNMLNRLCCGRDKKTLAVFTEVLTDMRFKKVAVGLTNTVAIDSDNALWRWGGGKTEPERLCDGIEFTDISVREGANLAIDRLGNLWGWGDSFYKYCFIGQNGIPEEKKSFRTPSIIDEGIEYGKVTAKNNCVFAVDGNGKIAAWGKSDYGQLGGNYEGSGVYAEPTSIVFDNSQFTAITVSDRACVALNINGDIWTWGNNNVGQLGDGVIVDRYPLTKITLA